MRRRRRGGAGRTGRDRSTTAAGRRRLGGSGELAPRGEQRRQESAPAGDSGQEPASAQEAPDGAKRGFLSRAVNRVQRAAKGALRRRGFRIPGSQPLETAGTAGTGGASDGGTDRGTRGFQGADRSAPTSRGGGGQENYTGFGRQRESGGSGDSWNERGSSDSGRVRGPRATRSAGRAGASAGAPRRDPLARLEQYSPLQRAILLKEILGPPKGLE